MIDRGYIDHLLDVLAPTVRCTGKRMFGGWAIMTPAGMIGLVSADHRFYMKTDALTRPVFLAAGGISFEHRAKTGKTMSLPYVTPPENALESADDMRPWAKLALEVMGRRTEAGAGKKRKPAVRKAVR